MRYAPERGERTPFGIVLRCTGFLANRYGEPRWLPRVREHPRYGGTAGPVARESAFQRSRTVADLLLVLLTVGLFVVLALLVRAVERL